MGNVLNHGVPIETRGRAELAAFPSYVSPMNSPAEPLYCTYEDRPEEFTGVAVLLTTLHEFTRPLRVVVFGKNVPPWFRDFAASIRGLDLREDDQLPASGWSVKPFVLAKLLDEGAGQVVWLDSDMLFTGDPGRLVARFDSRAVIVAEEPKYRKYEPYVSRAKGWGLTQAREFSPGINSCVVRVTGDHRHLIDEWSRLLLSDSYTKAQRMPFLERPRHLAGDQDVLHALLASSDFSHLRIELLRADVDIAQCCMADGYSTMARLRHLGRGTPLIVHSQGFKPWREKPARPSYCDVSPYLQIVRKYASILPTSSHWVQPQTRRAAILLRLLPGPNLPGIPFSVWTGMQRMLRIRTRLQAIRGLKG